MALGILSILVFPLSQLWMAQSRQVVQVPRRVFASLFAQNLLDERMYLPYEKVQSVRKRQLREFRWIKHNFEQLQSVNPQEPKPWLASCDKFLSVFRGQVLVTEVVPDEVKAVEAVVSWNELDQTHEIRLTGSRSR